MKISNKVFFQFFFYIFFIIPISSFIQQVCGQTTGDQVIISDFLKVDLIKFNDDSPGDTKRNLNYMPGGRDLVSFENMGILEGSYNPDTNSFVVWAKATFGFEVNAWSACLITDIFPEIEIDSITEVMYFRFRTYKHAQLLVPFVGLVCLAYETPYYDGVDDKYCFKYREIDYGDIDNLHNHDGNIETKIWIDPGRKLSGEMTVAGQTFSVPKLESDILDLTIADMRGGECGSYEDRYTDGERDEEYVEFTTLEGEYYVGTTVKVLDWINEKKIGVGIPINLTGEPTLGGHDGVFDLTFKGYDFPGTNENEMTFNLPIHIQPQVTVKRQYIPYTGGDLKYYPCCGKIKGTPVTWTDSVPRDLSIHIYNVFAHYDLEVKTDLFMDCQFTGKLSETFLDDPNLIITDRIWDTTLWQKTPEYLILPQILPWWMWLLIILIIGVGVYLTLQFIVRPYIQSKKKAVQITIRR